MHTPVLLQQAVDALDVKRGGVYIDATFGQGGHAREILKRGGKVLGIDFDEENIQKHSKSTSQALTLVHGNFKHIASLAQENGFDQVDGILFDFGISMNQINLSERGFSYRNKEEPLDMRISISLAKTAADIVNNLSEMELYEIFTRNAEEINSRQISRAIVRTRSMKKITSVGQLVGVIDTVVKGFSEREATYRRIFQALRIEVNDEFENLRIGLEEAVKIVKKGGRIVLITFHPTEDRLAKQFIRSGGYKMVTQKPVTSKSDVSYERSAKLRIIEV